MPFNPVVYFQAFFSKGISRQRHKEDGFTQAAQKRESEAKFTWSSFVERFNPRAVKVMEKESQARKEEEKKSGT